MKRFVIAVAAVLLVVSVMLLSMAPDTLSMLILGGMCLVLILGYFLGLMPSLLYGNAFRYARHVIEQTLDVQASETWIAVFRLDSLFQQRQLDKLFSSYKYKVNEQKENGEIAADIVDYINEDVLALETWQGLVSQIPGVLTGFGILGTFIGLIMGISTVGFSSVEAALESVATLLSGIEAAFYTSISGVILSIIFNILYRLIWNSMLREYGMFVDIFHRTVIEPTQEQERLKQAADMRQILSRLDRIPKQGTFAMGQGDRNPALSGSTEQSFMSQITEAMRKEQITFYLQPVVELSTRKVVSAEALARWQHETLGLLTPSSFVPMLESNGYITRVDTYLWEQVCKNIRKWIDSGLRPVPISVHISKMDLMAMDIPTFFGKMLEKYRIPPRALTIEVAKAAYIQAPGTTGEVVQNLRRLGFKVVLNGFEGDFISLNMLENVELDAMNLDLRLLPNREYATISGILERGRKLNVEIYAKSIENAEEVTNLRRSGCSIGQGFFFYPPMSIAEFENFNTGARV